MDKSTDPQNYKLNRLKAVDHIGFFNYNESINQEIATVGATQYVQVNAVGVATYRQPDLRMLTDASQAADSRFFQHSTLQMSLSEAQAAYDRNANVHTFNGRQTIIDDLA